MAKLFDIMGNFPFKPEDKKPTLIRKQDYSTALYPPNNAFTSDNTFTMITTVSAILFMFVWTIILCSYLVYRKQRPHLHEKSIYKMPLGKLMCWVCMAFFVFVLVLLTLEDDTRQALLVTPLWFIALGLGWLFIGKKRAAELRK